MAVSVPRRGESGGIVMIGPDLSRVAAYVRPGANDANSKYCAADLPYRVPWRTSPQPDVARHALTVPATARRDVLALEGHGIDLMPRRRRSFVLGWYAHQARLSTLCDRWSVLAGSIAHSGK